MRRARYLLLLLAGLVLAVGVPAAWAQEAPTTTPQVSLITRFPGVDLGPGDSASFPLLVSGPEGERLALEVTALPEGWTATLQGSSGLVREMIIDPDSDYNPTLKVTVAEGAPDGDYTVTVTGTYSSGSVQLDLHLRVLAAASGGIEFTTDYPGLRGAADDSFSFTLQLKNDTPQELLFGLSGEGPVGWVIDARPEQQTRASTVTLSAGLSGTIKVDVDPPDNAAAGEYTIIARAQAGDEVFEVPLTIEITGNYDMAMSTPGGLLNFNVEAGATVPVDLVVTNNGTAPLSAVTFVPTLPNGWTVAFDPETLDQLAPGGVVTVTANITAAEDAVAGDYAMAFTARSAEDSAAVQLRATVETSAWWGLLGIAVIVVALGALGVVFWRFGRR
jgi:uncharacterized membrane protein